MFKKFFLIAYIVLSCIVLFTGCATFSREVALAKAEKIRAEAEFIKLTAKGYQEVAFSIANNIDSNNAHLIPIAPDDPRQIITGKLNNTGGNVTVYHPSRNIYDLYGRPGRFGNGYWSVGK